MITREYVLTMATYNQWINARVYGAARKLPAQELASQRKAFFGSIIGTLNHIVVGDTIWLKRFATHPSAFVSLDPIRQLQTPAALDQKLFEDLEELFARRGLVDAAILRWAGELTESDLRHVIVYNRMGAAVARKPLQSLLVHFFNHQTHHRGQVTTLLSQAGVDVGVTDILALMPDVAD
ncbi:MAG: DinB family protein [Burkholderiales bacterium]|jgi:uncharacterized damage-inducible protein DinB